jgi:hypothetical protein
MLRSRRTNSKAGLCGICGRRVVTRKLGRATAVSCRHLSVSAVPVLLVGIDAAPRESVAATVPVVWAAAVIT